MKALWAIRGKPIPFVLGLATVWVAAVLIGRAKEPSNTTAPIAPTPPMGWNSWDSYGLTVTQSEFQANAGWMSEHLLPHGWKYAVVDEGWYLPNPEAKPGTFRFTLDANGRYTPALNRFPLAAKEAGFSRLADWVHAKKMMFGIHVIHGIPREAAERNLPIAGSQFHAAEAANKSDTCRWNSDNYGVRANAAGQAYYDSLASLYAGWGVDFVKIDCITVPFLGDEIRMFSSALRKTGRPIVLSLSPGPTPPDKIDELRKYAQMWRISDDFWDHWKKRTAKDWRQSLFGQFQLAATWAPLVEPGHWPDADMLPLGHLGPHPGEGAVRETALTHAEQRTLLTLWSMMRSPLIAGCNLTQMDDWTTALLTNDDVIAVDQHSRGGRQVMNDGKKAVWVAKPESGKGAYIALFNLDDAAGDVEYPLQSLGLGEVSFKLRDLWDHKDVGSADIVKAHLAPHAAVLYRLW